MLLVLSCLLLLNLALDLTVALTFDPGSCIFFPTELLYSCHVNKSVILFSIVLFLLHSLSFVSFNMHVTSFICAALYFCCEDVCMVLI